MRNFDTGVNDPFQESISCCFHLPLCHNHLKTDCLSTFKLQLASVCRNGKRENSPVEKIIRFTFEKTCSAHDIFSAVHYLRCLVCEEHIHKVFTEDRINTGCLITADNSEEKRNLLILRAVRFQKCPSVCWEVTNCHEMPRWSKHTGFKCFSLKSVQVTNFDSKITSNYLLEKGIMKPETQKNNTGTW